MNDARRIIEMAASIALDQDIVSYSGRGMYGTYCVSVPLEHSRDLFALMIEIGRQVAIHGLADTYVRDALAGARTDSLGLGTVVYWPNIAWEESNAET